MKIFRSIYLSMKLINGDILISMLLLQNDRNLERSCSVTFPESEIIFITLHLLGSKMTDCTISTNINEQHVLSENIQEFITCVSQELGIDMSNDHKLHTSLLTYKASYTSN